MSICGYHDDMGAGIRQFSRGLLAAISEKAESHERDIHEQFAQEADQMAILLTFLQGELAKLRTRDETHSLTTAFIGIVLLAKGLLGDLVDGTPRSTAPDLSLDVRLRRLVSLLESFEAAYEDVPASTSYTMRTEIAWSAVQELLNGDPASNTMQVTAA